MYAVIRAGGKQYRVAPGDIVRLETQAGAVDGKVEFNDVLAVSMSEGQIARPSGKAVVTGEVLGEGRGKKILVFHYKRKKQYKKLAGHRQGFTAVRITGIAMNGQPVGESSQPETRPAEGKVAESRERSATGKSR